MKHQKSEPWHKAVERANELLLKMEELDRKFERLAVESAILADRTKHLVQLWARKTRR